ncbi:pentatricopeptide repeat-containing protein [Cocos nucifera]|uniref:Pentatricopeptide repeat-containing protein n=1 Tax=Cocos nucifera TaxID=13894 RepID=A0A8K0MY80_COCNU|nr:pentatricopeptide repeat-containing protein [Cocos nucifera]
MDMLTPRPWRRCPPPVRSSHHPEKTHHLPSPTTISHPKPSSSPSSQSTPLTIRTNLFFSSAAKSHPLDRTLKLFHLLPARDTVTWNTAISATLRHGRPDSALRLFLHMLRSFSSAPCAITIRLVLKAVSESNNSEFLPQMHAFVFKLQGLLSSSELTVSNTCLLNLYLKFGFPELAHKLFCGIPHSDVEAFTCMLMGYAEAGQHAKALRIFKEMIENDQLVMNEHVYSCALHACAGIPFLFDGRQIHAQVIKSTMASNAFVGTSLVDMYTKSGDTESTKKAFLDISEPSVVSWNALIAGNLSGEEVLQLFGRMRLSGISPDHVTFACVLRACKDILSIHTVQQLHGLIVKMMQVELDVFVGEGLFEVYMDLGCFNEAQKVFSGMVEKDDVAFNLLIQGYLKNGHGDEAVGLFLEALEMQIELSEVTMTSLLMTKGLDQGKQFHSLVIKFGYCDGHCSLSMIGSLIRMYSEHHCLDDALRLFEQIHHPDLVLWTSLISGFSRSGKRQEAINLYARMVAEGSVEPPNHYTYATILSSCARLAALGEGRQIHAQIIKSDFNFEHDSFVASGLSYMYAKCGYLEESSRIFNEMPERDLASWNAMISSLAQHGFAEQAIEIFQELLKQNDIKPNHITFVGVLSACSRCGMVDEGYQYFKSIEEPTVDHYACVVDMFGRAGRLKEAMDVVGEMPFEANEHIWSSILSASRIHGNIELGEYSARRLLDMNPKDPGTYIALSNIYAAAGRWDDMKRVRKLMESRTDGRNPGLSWLRVNGQKYVFFANGRRWQPNSIFR